MRQLCRVIEVLGENKLNKNIHLPMGGGGWGSVKGIEDTNQNEGGRKKKIRAGLAASPSYHLVIINMNTGLRVNKNT